jgi:hypothetical protein
LTAVSQHWNKGEEQRGERRGEKGEVKSTHVFSPAAERMTAVPSSSIKQNMDMFLYMKKILVVSFSMLDSSFKTLLICNLFLNVASNFCFFISYLCLQK